MEGRWKVYVYTESKLGKKLDAIAWSLGLILWVQGCGFKVVEAPKYRIVFGTYSPNPKSIKPCTDLQSNAFLVMKASASPR